MYKKAICAIGGLIAWIVFILPAEATDYSYTASQATTISGKTFAAGDVVTLTNGSWENKSLTIKGAGTQSNPIRISAESAGGVVFSGSSVLTIDGQYIEVSGVLFSGNTTIGTKKPVEFSKNSSYCRFTDSAIRNYNPSDTSTWPTTDNKWVSINGTHNRVDHCFFENKRNIGTLLVVWLVDGQAAYHRIDHNHFYSRTPLLDENNKEVNGQETIRIGTSAVSMTTASCVVENNFFEACNGEIEVISNKSCGNIYRYNVFYNNNASLTLRHGNGAEVYGNYFFGKDAPESGGIRVIGENHKIYNNYFQDLKGGGYRTGICLINGKENSESSGYFQVKNTLIAFNTFYNCANVFNVAYGGGNELPPISTTIAHNVIYAVNSNQLGVNIAKAGSAISWKNNWMYQGKFTNFSPVTSEFVKTAVNPNFQPSDPVYGIYLPTAQSTVLNQYKTSEYADVTVDISGRPRPEQRMIGAFELVGDPTLSMPTPETVGCSFINKNNTSIRILSSSIRDSLVRNLQIYGGVLSVESSEQALQLKIRDVKGRLLEELSPESVERGFLFSIPDAVKGFLLLSFDNGAIEETRKVVIL